MKKWLGRLALAGAAAGLLALARGYLKEGGSGEEVARITFDDDTDASLDSNSVEGQELSDIARKLVEIGV